MKRSYMHRADDAWDTCWPMTTCAIGVHESHECYCPCFINYLLLHTEREKTIGVEELLLSDVV